MKKLLVAFSMLASFQTFASCYGVLYVPSGYAFITKPVEVSCYGDKDDQAEELFNALNSWIESLGASQLGYTAYMMSDYVRTESLSDADYEVRKFAREAELQTVFAPIKL